MSTAAGPTGGRALRLSGKSGQSPFLVARTNASVSSEPITRNSKKSASTKKPDDALHQPGPSRHAEQHTALQLAPSRELRQARRDGIGGNNNPNLESSVFVWHGCSMPRDNWSSTVSHSRDRPESATVGNLPGPGCGRRGLDSLRVFGRLPGTP
jgi:hypothetical protein